MKHLLLVLVVVSVGSAGWAAPWEVYGWQVAMGTVFGYLGGALGARVGEVLAQAAGVGWIDGVLGPILCAYVGYAVGATLGAWGGVTWIGRLFELPGDPLRTFLGASLGTGLAFLLASVTDWEWSFYLAPPLASIGASLAVLGPALPGFQW